MIKVPRNMSTPPIPAATADTAPADAQDHAQLILESFIPYRLSVLSNRMSQTIAGLYQKRFGLAVTEWRVMAVLGRFPGLSANEVAERTAMDKVAVSRAVARLLERDLIRREIHSDDRRRSVHAEDADSAAWRLEPGHYLDTPAGLVMATPELASLAISWSRG